MNDHVNRVPGGIELSPELADFAQLCGREFRSAMENVRAAGKARGLPADLVCMTIVIQAMRVQALAVVAGDIPLEDLEGTLPRFVEALRSHFESFGKLRPEYRRPQ